MTSVIPSEYQFIFLLTIGFIFFIIGISIYIKNDLYNKKAIHDYGTISGYYIKTDIKGNKTKYPQFEFIDKNCIKHIINSNIPLLKILSIGEKVKIFYIRPSVTLSA